ncbi:hypothetical protein RB195_001735 [Necator americanus]|uniref:Uncharacterized protein n=1 Tax=Necator americanus TaxID=51031 RepID=A0ABR1DH67_NECAM
MGLNQQTGVLEKMVSFRETNFDDGNRLPDRTSSFVSNLKGITDVTSSRGKDQPLQCLGALKKKKKYS